MEIKTLINYLQTANLNFLIGSGASRPYFGVLGKIEEWLSCVSRDKVLNENEKKLFLASVYRSYCEKAIIGNLTKNPVKIYEETMEAYVDFLSSINDIVNKRGARIVSKQINLFTTNVDTMIENAAARLAVEFNDGFRGSINQVFDESNFRKTIGKASLHFQSIAELPVFNLYKMHGSINWKRSEDDKVCNDYHLDLVNTVNTELSKIDPESFVATEYDEAGVMTSYNYDDLAHMVKAKATTLTDFRVYDSFLEAYEKLIMVNPTKHKFQETVMDMHFYELMRLYSNSLEKENSILFVTGFSFADEHIAKLTMRAANSNPTLQIVIFAYTDEEETLFKKYLQISDSALNSNVTIITPSVFKLKNEDYLTQLRAFDKFSLTSLNVVLHLICNSIPNRYGK